MSDRKLKVKPSPGNKTITGSAVSGERRELPASPLPDWKPRKIRIGDVTLPYVSMQIAARNEDARKQGSAGR